MTRYGLGITTYREIRSENIDQSIQRYVKKGKVFQAAKKVNDLVRNRINWEHVFEYKGYPSVGTYEGQGEPSAHVYFSIKSIGIKELKENLKVFRILTSQDSILLYKYVELGGNPILEIALDKSNPLQIQNKIIKATEGKIGNFVTYIYALNRIVIVNVTEFDGLNAKEFTKLIPRIKKELKGHVMDIHVGHVKVEVI